MNTRILERQNVTLSEEARGEITNKFETLAPVIQHPEARIEVDIAKPAHGGYTVSATVSKAGEVFNAEAVRSTVTEGVDEVVHTLREHIAKHNDKSRTIAKRTGDMFKKMARFKRG
jgi:ribosome-associated translation inhibitor RaiA